MSAACFPKLKFSFFLLLNFACSAIVTHFVRNSMGQNGDFSSLAAQLFRIPTSSRSFDSGYCLQVTIPSMGRMLFNCNHPDSNLQVQIDTVALTIQVQGPLLGCFARGTQEDCAQNPDYCFIDFRYNVVQNGTGLSDTSASNFGNGTISCGQVEASYMGMPQSGSSFTLLPSENSEGVSGFGWLSHTTIPAARGDWFFSTEDLSVCSADGFCVNGYCTAINGPEACLCMAGYSGSQCVDIDECSSNNGGCGGSFCINLQGSYGCGCIGSSPSCLGLNCASQIIPSGSPLTRTTEITAYASSYFDTIAIPSSSYLIFSVTAGVRSSFGSNFLGRQSTSTLVFQVGNQRVDTVYPFSPPQIIFYPSSTATSVYIIVTLPNDASSTATLSPLSVTCIQMPCEWQWTGWSSCSAACNYIGTQSKTQILVNSSGQVCVPATVERNCITQC